jgi:tetratricopeptide (TPR) repeat protein
MGIWSLGFPDQARAVTREQLRVARQSGTIWDVLWSLTGGTRALALCGDFAEAWAWLSEARKVAEEQAIEAFSLLTVPSWEGFAANEEGRYSLCLTVMPAATKLWMALGAVHDVPLHLSTQALAHCGLGNFAEAYELAGRALDITLESGHRQWECETRLGLARALKGLARASEAQRAYEDALAAARSQHAKSWELRIAMDVARQLQQERAVDDALGILVPIYDWFTEGRDTKDHIEARALIAELTR